jgi:2-dehydropantoate 2-reductase
MAERRSGGAPRVAVLGAGAVGTVLAVPLARAGCRVVCVGREEGVGAIRTGGLTLVRHGEVLAARPDAVTELVEPVDVMLVTVKAFALDDAMARVAVEPPLVVPLLNGLEHVERLRAFLGGRVVAATIGRLEAFRERPAVVVQTTEGPPVVTIAPGAEDAARLLALTGAEIRAGASERAVLWEKAARLAPLAAATAFTQRTVGDLRTDPAWRTRLERALEDACAVAAAEGVPLDVAGQWAIIDAMPPDLTTSTARDVAAGRRSELDAITGAVVRAGRAADVPMPTLDRLFEETEERWPASLR